MRKALGALGVAVVLALTGQPLASPAHAGGFVATEEAHVQNMLNATRQSKGLGTLVRNDQLVQMARGQSVRQAEKGNIFHNPSLGAEITQRGLDWQKVGENVGLGPNVALIEEAFLNSPHHYENIVDAKFDAVGVGVVDGADGRRYVTQVFADLRSGTAPQPAAPASARPTPTQVAPQAVRQATPAPAAQPAAAAPAPQPKVPQAPPSAKPSSDPNVVVGGVVEPVDLTIPGFDQAKRDEPALSAAGAGPLDRIVDIVTFWS